MARPSFLKKNEELLWVPNPGPQTLALQIDPAYYFEIFFGGRRGGGKSAGGIGWLLRDREHRLLRALIVRRNSDDLRDWIDRAMQIYEPLGAKLKGNPAEIHWPSGAIFRTGHLKDKNAYGKYVGHEYQRMLIEELNLIPSEDNYLKLISSCRSTVPELKPQVMSNGNPSDSGFYWIKERWNLHGIPTKPIESESEQKLPDGRIVMLRRIFVPSGIKDNPYLDADPQYHAFLNSLPDGLREAWRDGSWDDPVIKGAYYTLELLQAAKDERIVRFGIDKRLKVHTVWDLGLDDSMAIGFWQRTAISTRLVHYYQNENFDISHYQSYLQQKQQEMRWVYGKHFAPHDATKREIGTGKTLVQTARGMGLDFEVVPRTKVQAGIQKVRLMFPHLYFNNADPGVRQLLNALRNYRRMWDENLLKYKDEPVHDWSSHGSDMVRYTANIEEELTNEDEGKEYEDEGLEPISELEPQTKRTPKDPFDGVDIGSMGHEPVEHIKAD